MAKEPTEPGQNSDGEIKEETHPVSNPEPKSSSSGSDSEEKAKGKRPMKSKVGVRSRKGLVIGATTRGPAVQSSYSLRSAFKRTGGESQSTDSDDSSKRIKMDTKADGTSQLQSEVTFNNGKYRVIRKLGQGNYGTVYECQDRASGQLFACKKVIKKDGKAHASARAESEIMAELDHPNIVSLAQSFEDAEAFFMVMEYCEGGTLLDHINHKGLYKESNAVKVMSDVVEAIKYCHAKQVVHNDLKPDNVMYVDDTENSSLKLIDFGLAKRFTPGREFGGPSGDIWAVGLIIYSLLCGYRRDIDFVVRQDVNKGDLLKKAPKITEAAKDLLRRMLAKDAKSLLITAQEILDHPWMKVIGPATHDNPSRGCLPCNLM